MKRFAVLALLALACLVACSTASARTAYTWPSSEKWAFVDDWTDNLDYGYRYPNLYADCLQKAAAKMFPSYAAMIRASDASFNRYVKSAAVGHCMVAYGDKYWD